MRERFEDELQLFRRHADAGVANQKFQFTAFSSKRLAADTEFHFALFRELDCVTKKVEQDLAQAKGIAKKNVGRFRVDTAEQFQLLLMRPESDGAHYGLHLVAQRKFMGIE